MVGLAFRVGPDIESEGSLQASYLPGSCPAQLDHLSRANKERGTDLGLSSTGPSSSSVRTVV